VTPEPEVVVFGDLAPNYSGPIFPLPTEPSNERPRGVCTRTAVIFSRANYVRCRVASDGYLQRRTTATPIHVKSYEGKNKDKDRELQTSVSWLAEVLLDTIE
jgi:hypothetical protein